MSKLTVELYGITVGYISGTKIGEFDFETDEGAFAKFGLQSRVLSEAVPLSLVQQKGKKGKRQNFFAELLPEERILENLAAEIGAKENDVIKILSRFGRDVAGAIQIYDPEVTGEPREPKIFPLNELDIANLLENTRSTPLGNRPKLGKTSLAGVQEKIVLANIDGNWNQVADGYPSTHILKPNSKKFPTMIFDEEYGLRIARGLGLAKNNNYIENFGGVSTLVIQRYDRNSKIPPDRIHQEDMNQALGASKKEKYQKFGGGKVTLERIAKIFKDRADKASLEQLLKMNVMAVAIGNLDLHAKNISILHFEDESSTIAPAYDTVPLTHIPDLDGEMALAVNGKYLHSEIMVEDLVSEAERWGIEDARSVAVTTIEQIVEILKSERPEPNSHPTLREDIQKYCQNLLAGKPAGQD